MEIMNDTNVDQDENLHQKILIRHMQIWIMKDVDPNNGIGMCFQFFQDQLQRNQAEPEKD